VFRALVCATRRRSGAQLAQNARRELSEITGLEPESVTSLARAEDGTWKVTVELLELSRVPETDDMLGSYEVGARRERRAAWLPAASPLRARPGGVGGGK
jgi:ADP-ribose pyrophosphatase YjhB (NUDIX family)